MRQSVSGYIATWFGVGTAPKAPGTFGSLAALPCAYGLHVAFGPMALLVGSMVLLVLGSWFSELYMRQTKGEHDPGEIVIDEVAGLWLLLAFLPATLAGYAVGFVLFRLFDILKPWPVSIADRHVKGGFGVMFDDILAGLYPVAIFYALSRIVPSMGTWLDYLK